MATWVFALLVIVGLFVFFKTTGIRFGKTWTFVMGFLILFFILSFGYILTLPETNPTTFEGFVHSVKVYIVWLGQLADNTATITGNVINTDWGANVTEG